MLRLDVAALSTAGRVRTATLVLLGSAILETDDETIVRGGSYYLTYHRRARPDQLAACFRSSGEFLSPPRLDGLAGRHVTASTLPDMVNLTRIYTKTGDDGTTALGDFSRTSKNDPRLAAYADCDEANSAIGVAIALGELSPDLVELLTRIQNDLFDVGADLCNPIVENPAYPPLRIAEADIERLEAACDTYNEALPKLKSFILPGGTKGAALLHVARTVTRRAERSAWAAYEAHPDSTSTLPAKYLNRLSDLLFILGRVANPDGDILWVPGANR